MLLKGHVSGTKSHNIKCVWRGPLHVSDTQKQTHERCSRGVSQGNVACKLTHHLRLRFRLKATDYSSKFVHEKQTVKNQHLIDVSGLKELVSLCLKLVKRPDVMHDSFYHVPSLY